MVEHRMLHLDYFTASNLVLCFFSADDNIHPEHFKYDSSDGARVNFIVGDNKDLYTYIQSAKFYSSGFDCLSL